MEENTFHLSFVWSKNSTKFRYVSLFRISMKLFNRVCHYTEMESSARFRSSSRCRRFRPISTFLIVDYWNTVRRALPESFLIGRFSSTLLSEVLYRTRYFPLQPTLTLLPIDFEVNSCLTSVCLRLSLHGREKRSIGWKESNEITFDWATPIFIPIRVYSFAREYTIRIFLG